MLPHFRLIEDDADRAGGVEGILDRVAACAALDIRRWRVVADASEGLLWLGRRGRLWRAVSDRPPNHGLARRRARDWIGRADLDAGVPAGATVRFVPRPVRGTIRGRFDLRSGHDAYDVIDSHVDFDAQLEIERPDGRGAVPVVGAVGALGLTFDPAGDLIGFHRQWQAPEWLGRAREIPAADSRRELCATLGSGHAIVGSSLAYEAVALPAGRVLRPVWIHDCIARLGDSGGVRGEVTMPASEWDGDSPRASGRSMATIWMQRLAGVSGTRATAEGFHTGAVAAGWRAAFDTGDEQADQSHWLSDAARWTEAVDLVFYTGHATESGWQVPDHGRPAMLHVQDIAAAGGLGRGRLRWLVVAGCGPLKDDRTWPGSGSAFRWTRAMGGLRMMLGYAADIRPGQREGEVLTSPSLRGEPLMDAWFETARRCQRRRSGGRASWAAALFPVVDDGLSPLEDRPFAREAEGREAPPPIRDASRYEILWTPV